LLFFAPTESLPFVIHPDLTEFGTLQKMRISFNGTHLLAILAIQYDTMVNEI